MKQGVMLIMFALSACTSGSGDGPDLESYRWKNRVILHHRATPAMLHLTPEEREKFEERDLVFLEANQDLRAEFDLSEETSTFILIGKDGKEKGGQTGSLDLAEWFELIDQMPMRQREMAEKQDPSAEDAGGNFSRDW
jgi:hypothetical protein